ncbi:MAG: hypothetical protein C0592_09410 [Marinilabiliales bacterium]|nr:MAG: hypothetical protein C0592_09410 [Marinilabiliales bacterium]
MAKTIVSIKKAIVYFAICTLLIVAALLLMLKFSPDLISHNYPWYLVFNFSLYAIALYVLLQVSRKHTAEKFVMIFLVTTVGKMLLAMIFILVMIMNSATDPVKDAILFMSVYLIYLAQELLVLMNARKVEN